MRSIIALVVLALHGCASHQIAPDETVAVDAGTPTPQQTGCVTMGNLPYSRTIDVDDTDPVPSGLLGELEDMHAGNRRTYTKKPLFPSCWNSSGAAAGLVANPDGAGPPILVWQIPTGVTVTKRIPYEVGEMMAGGTGGPPPTSPPVAGGVGFQYEVYGDGVTDYTINVLYAPGTVGVISGVGSLAGLVTLGSDTRLNHAAGWTTTGMPIDNLVTLTDIGVLYVQVVTSGGGSGIYLANLMPQYVR